MYTGDRSQANALPSALSILKCFSDKGKIAVADYKTWIIRLPAEQFLAPKFNKAPWKFFVQSTKLTQNPGGRRQSSRPTTYYPDKLHK